MGDGNIGMTAIKPPGWDRTGLEAFKYFVYNPDTGEVLSRTPISWLKITVFYCIYYSCLAAFWIGCLHIFFLTVPKEHPKWLLEKSIIGRNPGLGLRPKSSDKNIDSSMFVIKVGDTDMEPTDEHGEGEKNIDYAVRLRKYMKMYNDTTGLQKCDDGEKKSTGTNCIFDTSVLDECKEFPYGFTVGAYNPNPNEGYNPGKHDTFAEPCIFLKLNKIFNWKPTPIKCKDNTCSELESDTYEKMSPQLKRQIKAAHILGDADYVWVDCFGRYAADKESLHLDYFPPNQGMAAKYFPYSGGNYHNPLVAIKLRHRENATCSPKNSPQYTATSCGQLVQVECRAWFDGVKHSTKDKQGLVQFEIHMLPEGDNPPQAPPAPHRVEEQEASEVVEEVEVTEDEAEDVEAAE